MPIFARSSRLKRSLAGKAILSDIEASFILNGVVSKVAVQVELGWKLMAELLAEQEDVSAELLRSPRTVIKEAQVVYDEDLDGDLWLQMLKARNHIVHMYDDALVRELANTVCPSYIPAFQRLQRLLETRYSAEVLHTIT